MALTVHFECPTVTSLAAIEQWRSQDIADARAQHGHTTFVRNSAQSAEVFRRSGTCSVSVQ